MGTIKEALHESLLEKTNFWQNVLKRLVNVTLVLAKYSLPFRGFGQELLKDNKGNLLFIIQLLAKYDTVLDKLLQLAKGSPNYIYIFYLYIYPPDSQESNGGANI